jgi:pimeloyl-ACP methyl ester carboxylesterase
MGTDPAAARLLLGTMEDTDPAYLAAITMPVLVLCGDKDNDNGSADRLAEALPDGVRAVIPGTHMSSVTEPAMGAELVAFLTA